MKDWVMELCPEIAEWQAEIIAEQVRIRVESEREACAKLCEDLPVFGSYRDLQTATLEDAAAAIRARRAGMNRDDIIRMAREAGGGTTWWPLHTDTLERFAALVAENEREACAKVCDDKAKETFSGQCQVWGDYFARVIRARGEK